jgi:hypothetical protein
MTTEVIRRSPDAALRHVTKNSEVLALVTYMTVV